MSEGSVSFVKVAERVYDIYLDGGYAGHMAPKVDGAGYFVEFAGGGFIEVRGNAIDAKRIARAQLLRREEDR